MQTDVLIIGGGLCGSLLSWHLYKEGKSFIVIDDGAANSASRISAGIINPVTGRRYVTTWMIEELIDFAKLTYHQLGETLGQPLWQAKTIIDFFPSAQMRNAFVERIIEDDTYIHSYPDQNHFNTDFSYDFGCGEIRPAYTVLVQQLLLGWEKKLEEKKVLWKEKFVADAVDVQEKKVCYKDIKANHIIFCDGIASANHPLFTLLPFSPNKGEALIIECASLNRDHIFKKGLMLTPLPEENLFWVGSNYQWEFTDDQPSEAFYKSTDALLQSWLKQPYKILEHKAGVRPATLERRPFVGFHPAFPNVGILNGMGTKGASLAPFFAHQLAQKLIHDVPISPEADVHRFSRVLSKRNNRTEE